MIRPRSVSLAGEECSGDRRPAHGERCVQVERSRQPGTPTGEHRPRSVPRSRGGSTGGRRAYPAGASGRATGSPRGSDPRGQVPNRAHRRRRSTVERPGRAGRGHRLLRSDRVVRLIDGGLEIGPNAVGRQQSVDDGDGGTLSTGGVGASRALEQIAEERDRLCSGRRLGGQAGCPQTRREDHRRRRRPVPVRPARSDTRATRGEQPRRACERCPASRVPARAWRAPRVPMRSARADQRRSVSASCMAARAPRRSPTSSGRRRHERTRQGSDGARSSDRTRQTPRRSGRARRGRPR